MTDITESEELSRVTLAEIEAVKGMVPTPHDAVFHGSTEDFLAFLDSQPHDTAADELDLSADS